ncbi:hypothetical protein GCM10011609_76580 [Lentzea pudingi]|uniref:Uncharacterized protein n=1 Tax=Lentzea pudingi TaxID=1789439 RepID=A0ABQ2IQD8_9PSEU|nr:hypothetical protein GCM10011609_76580 [Lentzea pudingi]
MQVVRLRGRFYSAKRVELKRVVSHFSGRGAELGRVWRSALRGFPFGETGALVTARVPRSSASHLSPVISAEWICSCSGPAMGKVLYVTRAAHQAIHPYTGE